jgi:hypothetical protein
MKRVGLAPDMEGARDSGQAERRHGPRERLKKQPGRAGGLGGRKPNGRVK